MRCPMPEFPEVLDSIIMGLWILADAFVAWAAWRGLSRTPAGYVLAVAFALHAVNDALMLVHMSAVQANLLSRSAAVNLLVYGMSFPLRLTEIVGMALIPMSLRRRDAFDEGSVPEHG